MKSKTIFIASIALSALLLFAAATSAIAQQSTSCGACRNPNDAQDRSYCDLTTGQCVRQTAECPPFFIEEDGSENKCVLNYARDPNTGQCLYRAKFRAPTGCLNEACNPTTGEFELVTDDAKAIACGGNNDSCAPPPEGCPQSECRYQGCSPAAEPQNCALSTINNCYATNPSTCQEGVPASAPQGISAGSCQNGNGCIYTATACAPPSNPCEELVRDPNAIGCCTYRPRDCAAEFGNNPNYTYSCDPTATNGVCKAMPKGSPEICDGVDNDLDGQTDEGFTNTDGDALADCVDPDDDNDGVLDTSDNCPLVSNPNQADFDLDGIGDTCDAQTGPPTDKEQCKNGGWMRFTNPTFKNQGDCIQFVNTGR